MKKFNECKTGDFITILAANGIKSKEVIFVNDDYLYLDDMRYGETCIRSDSWYDTLGGTIYLPSENYQEILKFYNVAVEHGIESIRRQFKMLFEIKK